MSWFFFSLCFFKLSHHAHRTVCSRTFRPHVKLHTVFQHLMHNIIADVQNCLTSMSTTLLNGQGPKPGIFLCNAAQRFVGVIPPFKNQAGPWVIWLYSAFCTLCLYRQTSMWSLCWSGTARYHGIFNWRRQNIRDLLLIASGKWHVKVC